MSGVCRVLLGAPEVLGRRVVMVGRGSMVLWDGLELRVCVDLLDVQDSLGGTEGLVGRVLLVLRGGPEQKGTEVCLVETASMVVVVFLGVPALRVSLVVWGLRV